MNSLSVLSNAYKNAVVGDRRQSRRLLNCSRQLKATVENPDDLPNENPSEFAILNRELLDSGIDNDDGGDNGDVGENNGDVGDNGDGDNNFGGNIDNTPLKYCCSGDSFLAQFFEKERQRQFLLPYDHDLPFDRHCSHSKVSTIREFCIDFAEVIARNTMKASHVNDVLEVFRKHTTSLNLPIVEHNRKSSTNRDYQPVTNNINDYAGSDNRTIVFDVCIRDCIIFHGIQDIFGVMMDCSELIVCPKCSAQRYSPCSNPACKDKQYSQCNPFYKDPFTGAKIHHQNRTPSKTLYYRPIAAKLLLLYKVSLTQGNEGLLKYFIDEYRVTRPGAIIDINDGLEVQNQLNEMLEAFECIRRSYRERSSDTLFQCSILMTMFYDGITLFERKSDSLMPMMLSVANCNPSNRSKLGVGMSLVVLHNIQAGSGAEIYFQKEILAVELLQLEKGIIFKFMHPEDSTVTVKVLLQARLVFFHMDTIEFQKMGMLKGSNSNDGCVVCGSELRGQHRECLSRRIYLGERIRLHDLHWLRQFGEEHNNGLFVKVAHAEHDFYLGGINSQQHIQGKVIDAKIYNTFNNANPSHRAVMLTGATTISKAAIQKANTGRKNLPDPRNWYNNAFPLANYVDDLYYPIRDTRPQKAYSHMSNETYMKYGSIAEKRKTDYIVNKRLKGQSLPKDMPDFAYRGVHGVCPLVRCLKGFRFERFCYDFMHYISNSGTYFLEFFKGERGLQDNSRLLCVAQNVFPYLQFRSLAPPWKLFNSDIIKIDSICNSLLIPRGYKNSFNMLFPARRTGHLRASDHLTFMTAYANYLYSFTRMKSSYRSFVARFSSDLCRLTQPCLMLTELDELILSIFETRSLQEGLFPDSEKQFIFHEIVDIVNNIKRLGHVDGIQCYSGERSLSTIGRMLAKGGVHYVKGMFYRYIALENTFLNNTKTKFEFLDNTPPCIQTGESKQKYSDVILKLHGEGELITLTAYETNILLDCVINYLEVTEIDLLNQKSSFYRLNICYKANKLKKRGFAAKNIVDFYGWITALYTLFNDLKKAQVSMSTIIDEMSDLVDVVTSSPLISLFDIATAAEDGRLFSADFEGIVREVALFPTNLTIKTKVFIKGLRFNCRGQSFREAQAPNEDISGKFFVTNPLNDLDQNWWKAEDHSSWCRTEYYRVPGTGNTRIIMTPEMGQLNFCFRLNWKSDSILYGLAFGNIIIRKTNFSVQRLHHHITTLNDSYNPTRQFVCLNNVCGTALAVSVLDKNDLPLLHHSRANNMSWARETKFIQLAPPDAAPHIMYFLELHPHRASYLYRSIEDDLDGTRHWDI